MPHKENSKNYDEINKEAITNLQEWKEKYSTLKQNMTKRNMELETINEIILMANKLRDLKSLLEGILDSALKLLNFDGGGIYLINEAGEFAELLCTKGLPADLVNALKKINIKERSSFQTVFLKGKPIITDNYNKVDPDLSKKWGILGLASIPFFAKGKVIGAMNIANKKRFVFSKEEINILLAIGRETGILIDKLRSEEDLIKKTRYLELSNKISEYLNRSIDLNDIAKIIKEYLGLYTCQIAFIDKQTNIIKIEGLATNLPPAARKIIKNIKISLNKNKKADNFISDLKEPMILKTDKLIRNFLEHNKSLNKLYYKFSTLLSGEELITPIFNSKKEKIGAMIYIKKDLYFRRKRSIFY